MTAIDDWTLFYVGGVLHEARMAECYGKHWPASRKMWPADLKEFRRQQQAGQPWIDVAIAQVRALIANGIAAPNSGRSLAAAHLPSGDTAIDEPSRISDGLGIVAQQ